MDLNVLFQYMSKKLHTIIRQCSSDKVIHQRHCARYNLTDFLDDPEQYGDVLSLLLSSLTPEEYRIPCIFQINSHFLYAVIPFYQKFLVLGPLAPSEGLTYRHTLTVPDYINDSRLYYLNISQLSEELCFLYNLFSSSQIISSDVISANFHVDRLFTDVQVLFTNQRHNSLEYDTHHKPYDNEHREMESIRTGDLKALKDTWQEDCTGTPGPLSPDELRNNKNLSIVVVTLASRAAIAGGLDSEIAFSLSDSSIMRIEEAKSSVEAVQICRQAEYQYATMVHELKHQSQTDPHSSGTPLENMKINQCKNYICAHLHGKITLQEIAGKLYVNPNYLCTLFKREEGITIKQYILQQKVDLAKNMLKYSSYSYSQIATYLGFSSQSHLGTQFKKVTDMTLHQFREVYGNRQLFD